ncbi:MAG TPA: tyrosine--tRNA ligase [Acidimicrobiia bacterium]|nr:tyrosine--tRNA ligase [Acidimicrobiia bacterium]
MTTGDQLDKLMRGVDVVQPGSGLEAKLAKGMPLRVKLGLDPTAPAVTLGWAVVLRKLAHFQEHGHTAVLIVGDFTAQVGDPSGKSETRRRLSHAEVMGYADAILEEFQRVLLPEPLEIRYNSEWLGALDMAGLLELTSKATVAQMLERGDFAKRFESNNPISVMEFLYPLLQGYDSVAIEADVELGGSDQLWNLMMGREVQRGYGLEPQVALTMPLLVGTDGHQKMSQSLDNFIGVAETPTEQFGKTMSIPDELIVQWFELATEVPLEEIGTIRAGLADASLHPNATKRRLAREIVTLYHDAEAAARAEAAFDTVHKRHEIPDDIAAHQLGTDDPVSLPGLIRDAGMAGSGGEARRLLQQGAVRVDGEIVTEVEVARATLAGAVLQVGKRRFARLKG